MISYRATLDVPRELVWFLARLLAAERRRRATPRGARKLTCFRQAVLGLRWFRERTDPAALARDHGVGRATAYRYRDEVIAVLAAQAPDVGQALHRAHGEGMAHVILDGTLVAADRCTETTTSAKGAQVDLWYSGKAHAHGGNLQAVSAPGGFPLWVADVEPGSTHDLTAAREHVLGACYAFAARGLPTLADGGYDGAGMGVFTPVKQRPRGELHTDNQTYNALLRGLRAVGERGFALLTQRWRALQHVTTSPSRIGPIAQAALVLTHAEHGYLA